MGRPEKVRSVLLDASALIGVIRGDEQFLCLGTLLAAVDRGEIQLVESTAILAEFLYQHPNDSPKHDVARQAVLAMLESPDTQLVDVSIAVARKAGALRVKHGLKTWDAVHLATAIVANVDVMIARDHRFPDGDYEGVYVSEPYDVDDDKLFSN